MGILDDLHQQAKRIGDAGTANLFTDTSFGRSNLAAPSSSSIMRTADELGARSEGLLPLGDYNPETGQYEYK